MKNTIYSFFDFSRSMMLGVIHGFLLLPVLSLFLRINELTGFESLLIFFIITQFTVSIFKKWWFYFLIQIGLMLAFLYRSFPSLAIDVSLIGWISRIWQICQQQLNTIISGNTSEIPLFFAIVALFSLITLLSFSSIHQRFPYTSLLAAFGYLMILHTFTGYAILMQTLMVVGSGFLLFALSRLDVTQGKGHFFKLSAFTTMLTVAIIGLSYCGIEWFFPVQRWAETKTVGYQNTLERKGFFDWIDTTSPQSRLRQTGMGTDDTQLGGPLRKDYTRLFQAYISEPSYWKVLHRWQYTGEGWSGSNTGQSEQLFSPYDRNFAISSFRNDDVYYGEVLDTARVNWQTPITYVAQPYGWSSLEVAADDDHYTLSHGYYSDYLAIASPKDTVDSYTIDYYADYPDRSSEETLREDDGWRAEYINGFGDFSDDIQIEDVRLINDWMVSTGLEELQLPTEFPQRVWNLAIELTAGLDSEYEMVRAIESHLKSEGGYRYSLRDTEQTPPGEDYVDHFLFDSRVGYCDNFSTAMVTLLRSVGIPARWAKGFTPGNSQTDSNGENYYQITNANAHSWPEVYFPSVGWVPFEPSPSFANPLTRTADDVSPEDERLTFEDEAVTPEEREPDTEPETDTQEEEEPIEDVPEEETAAEPDTTDNTSSNLDASMFSFIKLVVAFLTAIGLIATIIGSYYFSWHLKLLTWLLQKALKADKLSLNHAAMWTLKLFELKEKRENNQTIDAYMQHVRSTLNDDSFVLADFSTLVDRTLYGNQEMPSQISTSDKDTLLETTNRLNQWIKYKK
ncbi:transglutaminase domain-containing protein [Marinilactibacillus kalidii]|uniref:transglutaminase domain-containing protein n=1 Tax=Marinilactibacillus kalidii TaxID=2820274 RepID=UPI001ABDE6D1|nr:transglutaminase domain-containing protein [Marinilactibacillus kalidii]